MRQTNKFKALVRGVGIVAAVASLAGGVTFAALQSQQDVLTGNTIETASAFLQISTDGKSYADSQRGFDFNNIVPGGPAVPSNGQSIYLSNTGGTPVQLKMSLINPPNNPNNVDLSKVNVVFTTIAGTGSPQSFSLQSLLSSGGVTVGLLNNGGLPAQYKIQISMASDAINGNGASLSGLDFGFSGTAMAS